MNRIPDDKKIEANVQAYLAAQGVKLPHNKLVELIARAQGWPNYNQRKGAEKANKPSDKDYVHQHVTLELKASRRIEDEEFRLPPGVVIASCWSTAADVLAPSAVPQRRVVVGIGYTAADNPSHAMVEVYDPEQSLDTLLDLWADRRTAGQARLLGHVTLNDLDGLIACEMYAEVPSLEEHGSGRFGDTHTAALSLSEFGLRLAEKDIASSVEDRGDDGGENVWVALAVTDEQLAKLLDIAGKNPDSERL